jgi:hypothetical protein
MTEPNCVPQDQQTNEASLTNQTTDPARTEPTGDPGAADQTTDLAPAPPQTERQRRVQQMLARFPKEIEYCGEPPTIPEPPMSFDEDLRSQEKMPLDLQYLRMKQRIVLMEMMKGTSISTISQEQQISRNTIYYWMRHDAAFIAAVNAWRRRARQEVGDQLLLLSTRAMNNVRRAVYDNNLQASLTVLKSQGLLTPRKRPKPRDKKSSAKMTPNVVMEHSRTTLAMNMPTPPTLPANAQVRQLPDAGEEK